jgi:TonB-linked outer membrane protein, SusC/RagA family
VYVHVIFLYLCQILKQTVLSQGCVSYCFDPIYGATNCNLSTVSYCTQRDFLFVIAAEAGLFQRGCTGVLTFVLNYMKRLLTSRWRGAYLPVALFFSVSLGMFPLARAQQSRTVTGTVENMQNHSPLQGVKVQVKESGKATATDAKGHYSIEAATGDVLVFSYVGMKTVEKQVGSSDRVNVSLEEDLSSLEEVVVIGYGSVRKTDLTGSVGQVDVKDMAKAPVGNFAEALAGRVAGVQVSGSDGQPGGGINIMIRGAGSLTQSTTPLYVVDGFPIEELDPSTLNIEDIESMTILKDASSTAVYGSRGANGVVLIQTKRGAIGEPVITAGSSLGFQSEPQKIPLMSPYEYLKYQQELNPTHSSTLAYFAKGETLEDYRNVKGIDWQDMVFRTGAVQIHNLAIRGGTESTKYSVSGNMYDQKGSIINTGYNRYSGRVTIDQDIGSRIRMGVTANYTGVHTNGLVINSAYASSNATSTIMMRTWMYRPVVALSSDVDLIDEPVDESAIGTSDFRVNPFIDLENQYQHNYTNLLDGNGYISYEVIEGLTLKSTAGIRHGVERLDRFFNSKTSQGSPNNPNNLNGVNGSTLDIFTTSFSNENTLTYQKTFNEDHNLTALGVFSLNSVSSEQAGYSGRYLPNENLGMDGLDQGVAYNPVSLSTRNAMLSYAARLDYNYRSKYLLTFTFRADGSSKFRNHWGYFPGVAIGWNMSNERFFEEALPFVSTSKIRASYGSSGNNRVGDFDWLPQLVYNINGYSFNGAAPVGAVYPSNVGNPDLRWENIKTIDAGYELGLLNDRFSLELDLYRRTTEDMLIQATLPPTTGFTSARKNIGKLRNEGLEITLNSTNVQNEHFIWSSSFNISFNKNTVMALNEGQQALYANGRYFSQFNKPLYISEVGQPAGMMMGFVWEGNYQYEHFDNPSPGVYILKNDVPTNGAVRNTIQPGDIKYRDLNGDGIVDDNDLTIIGRGQPIHIGGFANNFGYKGFSLNVFFQWSYGNHIYNANRLAMEGNSNGFAQMNQFATYINRWSPENQTNENYRTRGQGPIGFYSSRVVEDGSYLRLKTLSLDYSLPARLIKGAYLNNLTLTVAAQNLITWTRYSGMDPEVSILNSVLSPGFDFSSYPQARTITFGLKAGF